MPDVVWAEESKNGLRFEIRPSYDAAPTTSPCQADGQSSCTVEGTVFTDIPVADDSSRDYFGTNRKCDVVTLFL